MSAAKKCQSAKKSLDGLKCGLRSQSSEITHLRMSAGWHTARSGLAAGWTLWWGGTIRFRTLGAWLVYKQRCSGKHHRRPFPQGSACPLPLPPPSITKSITNTDLKRSLLEAMWYGLWLWAMSWVWGVSYSGLVLLTRWEAWFQSRSSNAAFTRIMRPRGSREDCRMGTGVGVWEWRKKWVAWKMIAIFDWY